MDFFVDKIAHYGLETVTNRVKLTQPCISYAILGHNSFNQFLYKSTLESI